MTGMIFVASDLNALPERLLRYLGIVGLVFLASVLVALLLSSQLQRLVSDPILHLAQVARSVAMEKNYSVRATKQSNDELGQLVDGFNEMLAQIQTRDTALLTARDEAEKANLAKSEFLSRMSHELRTPLNAILGFSQILEMDRRNVEEAENVQQILGAGRHLLALINEVLDISGIEAGRLALSIEPVHLGELVKETLNLVQPAAAACKVTLPEFACNRYLLADSQRLKQVMLNLLSNAVKYNNTGGYVMLATEGRTGGTLRIKVSDTGRGISAVDLPKMFRPFERLGTATTDIEGLGLGLAISKHLVEMMGGAIGVESTLGQGSTFWFELPLVESPVAQLQHPAAAREDSSAHRISNLLYIEDNLSNLKLVERIVARRPGMKVIAATRGELGLELARTHRPDLILLDLHLPDINGDKVLERLQTDPHTSAIPVVMISADATRAQIERMMAMGARHYLTKPLDVRQFLSVVDEMLAPNASDKSNPFSR